MSSSKIKSLTKKNTSNQISNKINLPHSYSKKIVDDLVEILKKLIKNSELTIKNFGKFQVNTKNERVGRNPKNKKNYLIAARKTLTFSANRKLKEKVNKYR